MAFTTKKEIFEQSNTWILDLTRQILTLIERYTSPVRDCLETEIGPFYDSDAHLAEIAIGMEPEPFGLAHVYQCIPYANPELFRRDFEGAVQRGWLKISSENIYQATSKGQEYHRCLRRELRQVYSNLHPLPVMQMERLDAILEEVVTAITDSATTQYKPAFDMELRLASPRGSTLQKICRKLSLLMAYRDDTYLNAWMEKEVNGYVWEAFSYIYKGQAQTAAALAEELKAQRQYDEGTYSDTLSELMMRGWVFECSGKYAPTTEGLMILAEVARTMTRNFFEPWSGIDEVKINQLQILMEALMKGLKSPQTNRWSGQTSTSRSFGWRSVQWLRDKER